MGFERNYQVKILTNQLNNISFSSYSTQYKIDHWFFSGFSDTESSFMILIKLKVNLNDKRSLPLGANVEV
jgi:hypothetical protein